MVSGARVILVLSMKEKYTHHGQGRMVGYYFSEARKVRIQQNFWKGMVNPKKGLIFQVEACKFSFKTIQLKWFTFFIKVAPVLLMREDLFFSLAVMVDYLAVAKDLFGDSTLQA